MNDDVLDRGREMFREMARRHRDAARDVASRRRALHELGLAAVEAMELLSDAVEQYGADLPADARRELGLVREAALERLERAGVRLDGAVGEALDLSRHRVIKARRRPDVAAPRVAAVVRAGVRVGGDRVRDAEVVVDEPEGK
jgi:molecular chaperone GrpE (heat shock protein)